MEKWKPAFDYEDFYEVSDAGRVKRIGTDRMGRCYNTMLKFGDRRGYRSATLSVDNIQRTFGVHRLVWEAFVGRIPPPMQINHINGVKDDNRLSNLELCTPSQNTAHAYSVLGLPGRKNPSFGTDNGRAKVTCEKAEAIRQRYAAGGSSQAALAVEFGIDQTNISRIVRNKTWIPRN